MEHVREPSASGDDYALSIRCCIRSIVHARDEPRHEGRRKIMERVSLQHLVKNIPPELLEARTPCVEDDGEIGAVDDAVSVEIGGRICCAPRVEHGCKISGADERILIEVAEAEWLQCDRQFAAR